MVRHVAVFVDGENISASHAAFIRNHAQSVGGLDVLRVYGNACKYPKWQDQPGYRFVHSGTGKNATDLLLAIEAMEHALTRPCDCVVIASSDRDFTHLAQRLRERGLTVIGIGEAKAPEVFRAACTAFEELAQSARHTTALDHKIREVIEANNSNGQGIPIGYLGGIMHSKQGIRISTYPERNWRNYLSNRTELYDLDARGPDAKVRFKPEGFA
ncbi:NYN domain-containing protein [Rhodophyticola sp. CCM32]|uniref:NYN domain-containing protein n=1 Tax=Rhodophyticola sp. CCM32 TaxID=2916397 RepID=UPI00107FC47F|nr:NYN domain-containing protein [Rhodophyticola sp. CCM32]QBY01761.1 NYN domain-containing protein [Rhodophyticola sp. CCM32]